MMRDAIDKKTYKKLKKNNNYKIRIKLDTQNK
jgi:hypothetical protein